MQVTDVRVSRKFNLGNYEMLEVGLEAHLGDTDNPLNILRSLEDMAELYLQSRLSNNKVAQQQQEPASDKGTIVNLGKLDWQLMPATAKGEWEKAVPTDDENYILIKETIEAKHGFPVKMEGYKVWLNTDGSLGRRKAGGKR